MDKASGVPIMSKRWAEAHDALAPARAEDLARAYTNAHANGTGPFMLESFEPGRRTVLVRNPAWWGLAQHPLDIDRLEQVRVDSPERGVDMLLRGEADFTQEVPAALLERVRAAPGVRVRQAEIAQVLYLGFDLASPELRTSSVKGRNPFKDRRVRQAVYQAIDLERVLAPVRGLGVPAGMIVGRPRGLRRGAGPAAALDPAKARALLAEAGYPDGFAVTLDCSSSTSRPGERSRRCWARSGSGWSCGSGRPGSWTS